MVNRHNGENDFLTKYRILSYTKLAEKNLKFSVIVKNADFFLNALI